MKVTITFEVPHFDRLALEQQKEIEAQVRREAAILATVFTTRALTPK